MAEGFANEAVSFVNEVVGLTARAVDELVEGFRFAAPDSCRRTAIPQVWFADDGSFGTDDFGMLQLVFDTVSVVARVAGLEIGVAVDGEGKVVATKTAWHGSEWDDKEGQWRECDDGREIRLVGDTLVPRVEDAYKHLGTMVSALVDHEPARGRLVRRCVGVLGALGRLSALTVDQFAEAADASLHALMAYYGRCTPMGAAACARIQDAWMKAMAAAGYRARGGRWRQALVARGAGGLGMGSCYPQAQAALIDQFDRALCGAEGQPHLTAVTSAVALHFVRLGYRPTAEAPTPLDWWPTHLLQDGALCEDSI